LYCATAILPFSSTTNVERITPLPMFTHPLPNTGVVVVDGSPQGWLDDGKLGRDTRPAGRHCRPRYSSMYVT
jgi:hypothetical protein